jgi:hypothetical protein
MKKLFLLLFILPVACTAPFSPYELGISNKTWQKYTPEEQQTILQKNQTMMATMNNQTASGNSCLTVTIADGKCVMPPLFTKKSPFKPVTFNISEGTCSPFELKAANDQKIVTPDTQRSITAYACYKNGVLMIDPSKYETDKMYGTVRIYKTPLWQETFTYSNINTSGFAKLQMTKVTIQEQEMKPEVCVPKTDH